MWYSLAHVHFEPSGATNPFLFIDTTFFSTKPSRSRLIKYEFDWWLALSPCLYAIQSLSTSDLMCLHNVGRDIFVYLSRVVYDG